MAGKSYTTTLAEKVWAFIGIGGQTNVGVMSNEIAMQNSTIKSAVSMIAESVAQLPLRLVETYSENGLDRRRILRDHKLAKLMKRPNSYQTTFEFIEMMTANALVGGGGLALKTIVRGEVVELHPVPYGRWKIKIADDGSQDYVVNLLGQNGSLIEKTYKQSEVVFLHGLTLNSRSGLETLDIARYAAKIAAGFEQQILKVAENGGRPTGIIKYVSELTPDRKKNLIETWTARFGPGGDGGTAVLDGDINYIPIDGVSAANQQVIENRRFQVNEIARYFGLHPAFLGEGTITSDLQRHFVKTTLRSWLVRWEQALARDLKLPDNLSFDFDDADLLRGDHTTLGSFLTQMLGSGGTPGIMSVNECRYELGLDPISDEWAQKPLIGGYENSVAGSTQSVVAQVSETPVDNPPADQSKTDPTQQP